MEIRKLELSDLRKDSFFQTLSNLRPIDKLPIPLAEKIFNECKERGIETYVAEEDGLIIGTIRLLFEPKFYHSGKLAVHIEDVATHNDYLGRGVAGALIRHTISLCREKECYKIILNCSDDLIKFYEKFGFQLSSNGLRLDL